MAKKKIVSFKDNEEYILEFADKQMLGNFSVYIKTLILQDMDRKNKTDEKKKTNDNKKDDVKRSSAKNIELDF